MQKLNHSQTIIKLDKICFSFTSENVINDVSLEIHKGDYLGIVGPKWRRKNNPPKTNAWTSLSTKWNYKFF